MGGYTVRVSKKALKSNKSNNMQFLEKIFFPLNIKRDKQNNNLLTDIKNRSIDLLEWLKKAFPYFVNVNNGLTNTTYSGDSTSIQLGGSLINDPTTLTFETGTNEPFAIIVGSGLTAFDNPQVFSGSLFNITSGDNVISYNLANNNGTLGLNLGHYNTDTLAKSVIYINPGVVDNEIVDALGNETLLEQTSTSLEFLTDVTKSCFKLDPNNGIYSIGDLQGHANNTNITINDLTQLINVSNVPLYSDDAAATVGGLVTGDLYKTTTGGSTFLKILP